MLQPETAAGSGTAGDRSSAADGGGPATSGGASGSTTSGNAAGSGGKTPAGAAGAGAGGRTGSAGSSGGGAAGQPGAGRDAAAGSGETGTAGAAGEAGGAGEGEVGGAGGEGGAGGDRAPAGAQDPDCDLTGIWAAKQVTVSEALGLPQSSNNWYYLEFKQSGTAVEVSRHFDCGIAVSGSATVTVTRKTVESLISHNVQVGRKATLMKDGASCKLDAARFWSIRGGEEARFLPNATRDSMDSIEQAEAAKPLPVVGKTDGAVDTESDGKLGVAFQVSGIITGTRNSVQRDWTKWFTEPGYEIPASMNWTSDLKIRADFDNQESILDPTSGLLVSGSNPKAGAKHILRLRFLGRDASDPRVSTIVKAADADTCFAIQDALPVEQLE